MKIYTRFVAVYFYINNSTFSSVFDICYSPGVGILHEYVEGGGEQSGKFYGLIGVDRAA